MASVCRKKKIYKNIDSPNICILPLLNAAAAEYNTQHHYHSKQDPTHRSNNQDDSSDVLTVWGHSTLLTGE